MNRVQQMLDRLIDVVDKNPKLQEPLVEGFSTPKKTSIVEHLRTLKMLSSLDQKYRSMNRSMIEGSWASVKDVLTDIGAFEEFRGDDELKAELKAFLEGK